MRNGRVASTAMTWSLLAGGGPVPAASDPWVGPFELARLVAVAWTHVAVVELVEEEQEELVQRISGDVAA